MKKNKLPQVILFFTILFFIISVSYWSMKTTINNQTSFNSDIINVVNFPEKYADKLDFVWVRYPNEEKIYCLYGETVGDTAYIDEMVEIDVKQYDNMQTDDKGVLVNQCKESDNELVTWWRTLFGKTKLLGTIHNHPNGVCFLSDFDKYSFGNSHHKITGIICGVGKVYFWSAQNVGSSIELNII